MPPLHALNRAYNDAVTGRHPQRNIVLTGFYAAGKTVVGRELARRMRRPFTDSADLRRRRVGLRQLLSAGESPAEAELRALEDFSYRREQVLELSVDALGYNDWHGEMGDYSFIVFLDPPWETLAQRLGSPHYAALLKRASPAQLAEEHSALLPVLERADLQLSGSAGVDVTVRYILHSFYT